MASGCQDKECWSPEPFKGEVWSCHFCCILSVKANHKSCLESRGGEEDSIFLWIHQHVITEINRGHLSRLSITTVQLSRTTFLILVWFWFWLMAVSLLLMFPQQYKSFRREIEFLIDLVWGWHSARCFVSHGEQHGWLGAPDQPPDRCCSCLFLRRHRLRQFRWRPPLLEPVRPAWPAQLEHPAPGLQRD